MTKMLTLFGRDVSELRYNELVREKRMQKYLLRTLRKAFAEEDRLRQTRQRLTDISADKEDFLDIYMENLEVFIKEIDYYLERRFEPAKNVKTTLKSKAQIKAENQQKRARNLQETSLTAHWEDSLTRDNAFVSWDRDRFMLIAADRGYQTEGAIIQDVGKELNLSRTRSSRLLNTGRFTWGQVLCLGAMFQMTPREFCDTFLSGYFTEQYGEYRADYENLSKTELLKRVIRPAEPYKIDAEERADD